MLKRKLVFLVSFVLFGLSGFLTSGQVYAEEMNFAVNAILPENQIDQSTSYFNLMMMPSQKQTLEVELRNDTDEEIIVISEIAAATTNSNGVVEYGLREAEPDPTLTCKMEDIITAEKEVKLRAKEAKILKLDINMPAEEYDGVLAGGITFRQKESDTAEEADGEDSSGMSIKNKFAYVIAILLQENDTEVIPELKLNDVYASQINRRNVIKANIQNIKPIYMNKMSVDAKIMRKGETEVLYELNQENMQMAPNSNFDCPIRLNGQRLEGGEYTLELTAASMGEEWTWTKDFTIDAEEAAALNENDVTVPKEDNTIWYLLIAAGVLLLITIALIIIIVKNKKKKKD